MRDLVRAAEAQLFERAIPVIYRLAGRPQFRIFEDLRARDRWSAERLAAYQLAELRRLVTHAATTVPYYRDLFRSLKIEPRDVRSLADYAKLPLLTKEQVRANVDRLCSEAAPSLLPNTTGGSTGVPMRFFQTRAFLDVCSAAWFRNYAWTGVPLGCRKFLVWGHPSESRYAKQLKGRLEHWLHRRLFFDAFDITREHVVAWTKRITDHGAEFGYGYASALTAFATFVKESGERPRGVRAIMSTAERLYPQARELIEQAFGCRVFDQYGSREIWSIASECQHGRMHVNSDLHLVEHVSIDDAGTSLVITPLHNYGMPLLRYVNEDLAESLPGTCSCGMPYPMMSPVQGRTSDNFKTPDGRIVHGEYLTHLMYGLDGIAQFQFVQRALTEVTLSVVRAGSFDRSTEQGLQRVAEHFARYFRFPLEVKLVDAIAPSASGKRRFTISLV